MASDVITGKDLDAKKRKKTFHKKKNSLDFGQKWVNIP